MWKLYLVSGASNNGGEHGTGSIISGKASFAHTGSVVHNEGGDFVFHFFFWAEKKKRGGGNVLKH